MDTISAQKLVEHTFKATFDKKRYRDFINELCNSFDESKAVPSMGVPAAFSDHIKSCQRLGTFTSAEGELADILIVYLTDSYKLERSRTALRDFVAHKLKRGEGEDNSYKEASLVAFVSPDSKSWRFSFVRMEYATKRDAKSGKIKPEERLTPAKRLSYLVGEEEECHTAQSRFLTLLQNSTEKPPLSQIADAFSVEAVTKEFFDEYRRLFETTESSLSKIIKKDKILRQEFTAKNIQSIDFTKKLLGQIVFLYFIQKKGWLGVPKGGSWGDGPHNFLRALLSKAIGEQKCFFNDVLEPLFYDTLATDRGNEAWCKSFESRIPFLNGGLFEPLAGYDWEKTTIDFSNSIFTNDELSATGDLGTGILDVFDRYNFTVNEAEPLEKEVAIDPEMLGKVFENLIEENRRKGLGAFYTPREIVHYMCQESLINYLDTRLNRPIKPFGSEAPRVEDQPPLFVETSNQPAGTRGAQKEFSDAADRLLISREDISEWIQKSDQFAHYAAAISSGIKGDHYPKPPESIRKFAREIDLLLHDVTVCDPAIGSGAFPVGMMTEIVRARIALTPYFNDLAERTSYSFKRHAIQNSLYGVDIDGGAVEIAKLRLWLSLVVDEEDVLQIKPLPNLDYKVVVGNSLLGIEKNLFNQDLFKELELLKPKFFNESDRKKKADFKRQIERLIHRITDGREVFDFEIYFSEVFHEKGGFDVMIANPPYVRVQEIPHTLIDLYKKNWSTAHKRIDISTLFLELGSVKLSSGGIGCYICSNQFLVTDYGAKAREYFLADAGFTKMLDFGSLPVFEEALTYVSIFFFQRQPTKSLQYDKIEALPFDARHLAFTSVNISSLSSAGWTLGDVSTTDLVSKLRASGAVLKSYAKCWAGLFTGKDDILLFQRNDPRLSNIEKELLLPVLRAQACARYRYAEPTHLTIYPYEDVEGKTVIMPESRLRKLYPLTYKYLTSHKKALWERKDSRESIGDKSAWYGLIRFGRLSVNNMPKIISPGEVKGNKFGFDLTGAGFSCARVFAVTVQNPSLDIFFLLGLLNSKIAQFYFHKVAPLKQGGYYSYSSGVIDSLPIILPPDQKFVSSRVEALLKLKEIDSSAGKRMENEIEEFFFKLYNLNADERLVVEGDK